MSESSPAPRGEQGIGSEERIDFATLSAGSAAALHLLEAVHASGASTPHLISDDDNVFYVLSVPLLPVDSGGDDAHNDDEVDDLLVPLDKWRIGAGPLPSLPKTQAAFSKVEILLCPPGNSPGTRHARKSIKSIHAVLSFHPESGALLLRNISSLPIIYKNGDINKNNLTLRGNGGPESSCVLLRQINRFGFGDYEFVLEFSLPTSDYEKFTRERNRLCRINPATCLAPVPSERHFTLWDVRVHGEASRRRHESVYYGIHLHSGQPMVVKRIAFRRGKETRHRTRTELDIAAASRDLNDGILGMVTSWCEHGESPPCWLETGEDVFYSMPLAKSNFDTMAPAQWLKLGDARLNYFHQTLSGLAKIHARGLTHGRIRPKSVMITSDTKHDPPTRAALTSAISTCNYGVPDHAGYWVAPEVWTSSAEAPYSSKADVWALAASWLRAFVVPPAGLVRVHEDSHRRIVNSLRERRRLRNISRPLHDLWVSMLAWDPKQRPSVEEALAHPAWEPVQKWEQDKDDNKKREREEKKRAPADGIKKVRVLSPEQED